MGIKKSLKLTNSMINGNFSKGTTGYTSAANLSVANNILSSTGTGSSSAIFVNTPNFSPIPAIGKKFYFKCLAKVTNANATALDFLVTCLGNNQSIMTVLNPNQNILYPLSGIVVVQSDVGTVFRPMFSHSYADASTANGKVMEVKEVMGIELSNLPADILALSNANLKTWCEANIPVWFDGTMAGGKLGGIGGLK